MILEYLLEQIHKARYELIDGGKCYYGKISGLRGVWATGKSLEECRANLLETLEGWLTIRLRKNLDLPKLKTRERKKIAMYV